MPDHDNIEALLIEHVDREHALDTASDAPDPSSAPWPQFRPRSPGGAPAVALETGRTYAFVLSMFQLGTPGAPKATRCSGHLFWRRPHSGQILQS